MCIVATTYVNYAYAATSSVIKKCNDIYYKDIIITDTRRQQRRHSAYTEYYIKCFMRKPVLERKFCMHASADVYLCAKLVGEWLAVATKGTKG